MPSILPCQPRALPQMVKIKKTAPAKTGSPFFIFFLRYFELLITMPIPEPGRLKQRLFSLYHLKKEQDFS
jgi:hypothetical protein